MASAERGNYQGRICEHYDVSPEREVSREIFEGLSKKQEKARGDCGNLEIPIYGEPIHAKPKPLRQFHTLPKQSQCYQLGSSAGSC